MKQTTPKERYKNRKVIVVRGNTELGTQYTEGEVVFIDWFEPTSIEIYTGDEGSEMLADIYQVTPPQPHTEEGG